MTIRSSTLLINRWSGDLMAEAITASERSNVHEASVYRDGALFKIASIRAELDELEAALKSETVAVKCVGRAAA